MYIDPVALSSKSSSLQRPVIICDDLMTQEEHLEVRIWAFALTHQLSKLLQAFRDNASA